MKLSIDVPDEVYAIAKAGMGRIVLERELGISGYQAEFYARICRQGKPHEDGIGSENPEVVQIDGKHDSDQVVYDVKVQRRELNKPLTLDEALAICGVDLTKYKVMSFEPRQWTTTLKDDHKRPVQVLNSYMRIKFEPRPVDEQSLSQLLVEIRKNSPIVPPRFDLSAPDRIRRELELSIMDPHLGLRCGYPEADGDWNAEIAEELLFEVTESLLRDAAAFGPFERIILPFGNDFLHIDNMVSSTTKGTIQPESDSLLPLWMKAEKLALRWILRLSEIAPVKVYVIRGNHDNVMTFAMGRLIDAYFYNNENVEVEADEAPYRFHRFGCNLVGFEHGHAVAPIRMAALMANERPQDWAETHGGYREWHLGDQHRKGSSKTSTFEEQGVSVEYLPGLTMPNAWHRSHSYNWQKRAGSAYVWDYTRGPVARLYANISNRTHKVMQ